MKITNLKFKILLIHGSSRQVLPMAKAFYELGVHVTTYNSSRFDYGYNTKYAHQKLLFNSKEQVERSKIDSIKNVIKSGQYNIVIPLDDEAAVLLAKHKEELQPYADIAVNNLTVFELASDKLKTMMQCMKQKIPCPLTFENTKNYISNKDKIKYPIVIKPRNGCGAVGFHLAYNSKDAIEYLNLAEKKYGACLIQEYIPQSDLQYKAEFYIDRCGKTKSAVVFAKNRWYPIEGGSSTLNETVNRPDIIISCEKLLKSIGWRGYADIDLIQDPRDGIAKIIEINPRITGSVKICFKAGVNFALQMLEDFLGREVSSILDYKKGIFLRYLQKDILWFIKSSKRWSTSPSWFDFRNSTDQIWDWKDPMPFIVSSFDAFPKLLKDIKKRKIISKVKDE